MLTTLLLAATGLFTASNPAELPDGWRLPTDVELADPMLSGATDPFIRVAADLNGDLIEDIALMLKSNRDSAEALWVYLSGTTQSEWILLDQTFWGREHPDVGLSMRINVASPGDYECLRTGQRYHFSTPGIEQFRPGSSSSAFFWSEAKGEFRQVWVGD